MSARTEIQNPLLRYAAEIGWTVIAPDEALTLRGGERKRAMFDELFRAMLGQLMTGRVRATPLI